MIVGLVPVARIREQSVRAVGVAGETVDQSRDLGDPVGVDDAEVLEDVVQRHPGELHVEAVEAHVAAGFVVGAHPLDHFQHRFGVPGPEIQAGQEDLRVAFAVAHIPVEAVGLGPGGLDREGVEVHLLDQEAQDPRLHLEEVAGTVGVLAERERDEEEKPKQTAPDRAAARPGCHGSRLTG